MYRKIASMKVRRYLSCPLKSQAVPGPNFGRHFVVNNVLSRVKIQCKRIIITHLKWICSNRHYIRLFVWTLLRHPGILKVPTFQVFALSFEFFLEFLSIFWCFDSYSYYFYIKMSKKCRLFRIWAWVFSYFLEFWVFSHLSFFKNVQTKSLV